MTGAEAGQEYESYAAGSHISVTQHAQAEGVIDPQTAHNNGISSRSLDTFDAVFQKRMKER